MQTNSQSQIIDWIHEAREKAAGIVIDPAAFTHTSIAILDALNTFDHPSIEVHVSNVHKREPFRHHFVHSRRGFRGIAGFGTQGYVFAVQRMAQLLATAAEASKG